MKRFTLLAIAALSASCTTDVGNESPVANIEKLPVAPWEQYLPAEVSSSLIDFSVVGVNYSNSGIPELALPIFPVTDFGAIANDGLEDKKAIQRAIDAAELAGGGIVLFPSGRFLLNETNDNERLLISSSKIVLRGSGNGQDGTELFMQQPLDALDPTRKWSGPPMIEFRAKNSVGRDRIELAEYMAPLDQSVITQDAQQDDISVEVKHTERFKAGDMVTLYMRNIAANTEFLQGKQPRFNWSEINVKGVTASETLEVAKVENGRLFFEQPLLTKITASHGWSVNKIQSITNVGLENLRFTGNFHEEFVHHKNALHDSGYRAVMLINTRHSWVRNVVFANVTQATSIHSGVANSLMMNVIEGNRGHVSFDINYGTRNLVALNVDITDKGQFHGPGTLLESVGNVIWRFNSPKSRGIDVHAANPRFTLYDNFTAYGFGGWGGHYKDLPNHLEGLFFWNFKQTGNKVGNHHKDKFNFWDIDAPKNKPYTFLTAVNPILVGYEGSVEGYLDEHTGHVASFGKHVPLESLYEAQLAQRLGKRPEWLETALSSWELLLEKHAISSK